MDTWDYFDSHIGVAQEVVQGVLLMIILSQQLGLNADAGSVDAGLGTQLGSWVPGVWCQQLDRGEKYRC